MRSRTVVPRPLVPSLLLLILPGLSPRASAAGFDETHRLWTVHGAQPGASFGAAVAGAGDVNGDGFPDVIVGAPTHEGTAGPNVGRAFVYHGSARGLSSIPDWEIAGEGESSQFGFAVASAGDVNGDGFDDVIVGAPYFDLPELGASDVGRIYVYLGSAQGLSTTPSFTAEGSGRDLGHVGGLGYAVSSGDFDGDGFSDVVASEVARYIGQVLVFYGSASGPSHDRFWRSLGGHFAGRTGSTDLNDDGYDDLFISAYAFQLDLTHPAGVHLGSPRGLPPEGTPPALTFPNGYEATPLGDVDGDGLVDVLTLDYASSFEDLFPAHVLYRGGSRSGHGQELGPAFDVRSLIFAADDLNGDGFADAIALDGSLFYVYFGSRSGFSPFSDGIGPAPGTTLAALPDVNGDGVSDLVVGDSGNERVDVYRGGADWSFDAAADVAVQKNMCSLCPPDPQFVDFTVGNAGPDPVRLRLVDLVPPSLPGFAWNCTFLSGAATTGCQPVGLQPGDIDIMINLLPGGSISFTAQAEVAFTPIVNTASLPLPPWVADPDLSNNYAVAFYAPPPMEMIFVDRFDSGDLSLWSSHSRSGLAVVPAPGHATDHVLQATASPSGPAVVRDETPAGEPDYHARFVLDPGAFGQPKAVRTAKGPDYRVAVLSGRSRSPLALLELSLETTPDSLFLRGRILLDDGTARETTRVPFTRAPHLVEVSWHRSSGPGAHDGQFQLRLDGAEAAGFTDLDNDSVGGIDSVALGLDAGERRVPAGLQSTVLLDDFESWRLLPR